ncbi:MAG: sigma-70 family RNA polymerase sigma factor [Heliobacteriaceae bacterium]|nr:sigma-70 family RNA polymerase sigma factor [Heliobacteriaceae bacterium]MDD4588650.1 sigma-70 family RNA polymerase sigma factor [Heliobacteriaceae bacterium]
MEADLLRRCREGDHLAFATLLDRYQTPVYNLAWRILQDPEEAKDATQEIFIRVYRALPGYRFEARFTTWLYRIATNYCLDLCRSHRRNPRPVMWEQAEKPLGPTSGQGDPAVIFERQRLQETVQQAIRELPPKYRAVITLNFLEGFTAREIAGIMGGSVRTAETRIYRAKTLLRHRLEPFLGKGGP